MHVRRRVAPMAIALVALAVAATAVAASGKLKATPVAYDPAGSGIVVAEWQSGAGEPDSGGSDHGLVLEKNGPTSTNAAPVVIVDGVAGQTLDELAFDMKNGSWCGAGSPRFNVTTVESGTHFYACYYGAKTDLGNGWTRVSFGPDTPFAGNAFGETIVRIQIVVDEGNDLTGLGTPGRSILDNIDVNGNVMGKPGSAV